MRQCQAFLDSGAQLGGLGDDILQSLLSSTHMDLSPEQRVDFTTLFCCSRCTRTCDINMLKRILKIISSWWRLVVSTFVCHAVRLCSFCFLSNRRPIRLNIYRTDACKFWFYTHHMNCFILQIDCIFY